MMPSGFDIPFESNVMVYDMIEDSELPFALSSSCMFQGQGCCFPGPDYMPGELAEQLS